MTPALLLLAALAPTAPPDAHDVLIQVGDTPAVRVRLKIEVDRKPLAKLDADAKHERDALSGKPGVSALSDLMPDGSLLRAEWVPASPQPAAVSRAIFKALDTDGDGKLSAEELAVADTVLLKKHDLDDDECVTPLELAPDLQTVIPEKPTAKIGVKVSVVPVEGKADLERTVSLGQGASHWVGRAGKVQLELFARSPFRSEKPDLPKSLLDDSRKEAKAAFEKVAGGVVTLHAVSGPVGLFDRLDTDRDGQLSVAELRRSKTLLADSVSADTTVSLVLTPGLGKPPAVPLTRTFTRTAGPAWFRGMDKNGDGWVSKREFIGTAEQFRQIDGDGDGLISPAEAERARKP